MGDSESTAKAPRHESADDDTFSDDTAHAIMPGTSTTAETAVTSAETMLSVPGVVPPQTDVMQSVMGSSTTIVQGDGPTATATHDVRAKVLVGAQTLPTKGTKLTSTRCTQKQNFKLLPTFLL